MKNNLDERQELNLLKIEHYGCWFAFWGLLSAILVQCALRDTGFQNVIGELVVFMGLAVFLLVGCLKEGIWARRMKPDLKTNLLTSTVASLAVSVFWFVISYRNYHRLAGSAALSILTFVFTNAACMLLLTITSRIYKKRIRKLEGKED